ncbi:MAG TPA: crossover junction endodeoxyribonuclease RuvC [Bryobacteraceae bacterium]|nr:crossover junction endodeoxyribonuclease RuvC [Bryobacteraceae bacterium]
MRIAGIDCGTERTGFGVIDSDGRSHTFVTAGVIRTKAVDALENRLKLIAAELRSIFQSFTPQAVAVEAVFHAINARSALKLAHVRGVALLQAAEAGLTVTEYSPLEVKMSVVGYGRAEKQQVLMMVHSLLRIDDQFASYDVSDALAVAICHGTRCTHLLPAGVRG